MTRRPTSDARRAVWLILGLLAIPFVSVTSAALVADLASTTDPTAALVGIPATLGGVITAVLVSRLARSLQGGAVAVREALARAIRHAGGVVDIVSASLTPLARPVLQPAPVPATVGRRGPPVRLR
ncbi:MAG: hypothetical protein AAF548_03515 [Actinomycetota bacterium]